MPRKLNPGEAFPTLTLAITGGGELNLPADLDSSMTVVLFFRGHW
jgi:peroxiredoxin